jgi:dihydrofolate reductase
VRDVVVQVAAMSLDGVIQEDDTEFETFVRELPDDDAHERWLLDSIAGADLHVLGRRTYEEMATYFPTAADRNEDERLTPTGVDEAMNRIPKVVFSKTLTEAAWGPVTIASGDTIEELDRLRRGGDGYVLVHGGVSFLRSLVELDAVDEYRLVVLPYLAGSGSRLFPEKGPGRALVLIATTAFSGIVVLTYRRSR